VLYGVFGAIVAVGLSLGAFAIAGRPIGNPAGPVQLVTLNPTEPSNSAGNPATSTNPKPPASNRDDHSTRSPSPSPSRDDQGGVGDD
jgi:hypothetical protein